MEQNFYCNVCKKDFSIIDDEKYWNYKCPDCGEISKMKGYLRPIFKGLPNTKR